jgi:hypothetical protein
MKIQLFVMTVAAALLGSPLVSFAQGANAPLTRDEVRQQLIQVEQAGYAGADNVTYPAGIQAAEAKVAARQGQMQSVQADYGPVMSGASQSGQGRAVSNDGMRPLYFGR